MSHLMGWKIDLKMLPSTYRTPSNSLYSVRSDAWNSYMLLDAFPCKQWQS
jgi:hypothetical protein